MEEIQKLIAKDAVKRVTSCPNQFLSQIFLVPKKDGTARPVINLRPLNQFIHQIYFKMENLPMIYGGSKMKWFLEHMRDWILDLILYLFL